MLNENQLSQIKTLQEICEKTDLIKLKLNWNTLTSRTKTEKSDFLFYDKEQVVGFLALYKFGPKYEICGMVHPDFRRQGIFTKLLNEALPLISSESLILLNAPAKSESAKAWLNTINSEYSFSEYQMKWNHQQIEPYHSTIQLRKAISSDIEIATKLDVECFGLTEHDAIEFNQRNIEENKVINYMIDKENQTVGKIRVLRRDKESWLYGFAVFPIHQGKGFGKSALLQTVHLEENTGNQIYLEVEIKNLHAMKLYTDCGFEPIEIQDYYHYKR